MFITTRLVRSCTENHLYKYAKKTYERILTLTIQYLIRERVEIIYSALSKGFTNMVICDGDRRIRYFQGQKGVTM